jgi:hypothetical protein
MRWLRVVSLIFLFTLPLGVAAQSNVYRNHQFGYEVPIPTGLYLFSPHEMNGVDHGRQLFFKPTKVEDCNHGRCDRYIEFDAYYNVSDKTLKLHDFFENECTVFGGKKCLPPPDDLKIEGLPCESAKVNLPDGRIEFLVVTQAGKPIPNYNPTVPSINYSVILLTTKEHMDEDMKFYRLILETIRIAP